MEQPGRDDRAALVQVPQLEVVGELVAAARNQLQGISRGARPTTLAPIGTTLRRLRAVCEGLVGQASNRHGFYRAAEYTEEMQRLQQMLAQLAAVLTEELGGGGGKDLRRQAADVIPDRTARRFWCVAFGGFVVDVAAGQFFASCERLLDGGEWLNFAALSHSLDPERTGRVEVTHFAEFVEREAGLIPGLYRHTAAPTVVLAAGSNRMGECAQPALVTRRCQTRIQFLFPEFNAHAACQHAIGMPLLQQPLPCDGELRCRWHLLIAEFPLLVAGLPLGSASGCRE